MPRCGHRAVDGVHLSGCGVYKFSSSCCGRARSGAYVILHAGADKPHRPTLCPAMVDVMSPPTLLPSRPCRPPQGATMSTSIVDLEAPPWNQGAAEQEAPHPAVETLDDGRGRSGSTCSIWGKGRERGGKGGAVRRGRRWEGEGGNVAVASDSVSH